MNNGLSWALGRTGALLLIVMVGIAIATPSYSAPSEENISGSAPLRPGRSRPQTADVQGSRSEPSPPTDPENAVAAPGTDEDAGAQVPGSAPSPSTAPPHKYFPYTVRSGDTPAGIAALFGIPLPEFMRANHLRPESELQIGDTLRVPNPFLAHERELSSEIDRLGAEKQSADDQSHKAQDTISTLSAQVRDLDVSNKQYRHDLRTLPWWRGSAMLAFGGAALMLLVMLVAVIQWIIARSRFRAVAEMNESLRRLDYKYKAALAKAELRFQELYGRRRRGGQDAQEQLKTPEELEIEQLNRQLKEVLERHLQRLEPSSSRAGRARWRERLAGIGAPMEARSIRR